MFTARHSTTNANQKRSQRSASRSTRLWLEPLEDRLAPADLGFALGAGGPLIAEDIGRAVATDSAGNVYVTGSFRQTVDFAPGVAGGELTSVSTSLSDGFVAKYSASGTLLWAKRFGDHNIDVGTGIAVDALGSVYVSGSFVGTISFGNGASLTNTNSHNFENGFVAKLDSSGNGVWAKQVDGPFSDSVNALTLDAAGNVYAAGFFQNSADVDPTAPGGVFTGFSAMDPFVWKMNTNGDFIWAQAYQGTGTQDEVKSIAVDPFGNVYATGRFQLNLDFPGTAYDSSTTGQFGDVFVFKLSGDGSFAWARQFGNTLGDDVGQGIAADASGNVYTTGYFQYQVDFDPGSGVAELTDTLQEVFVSKLDTNGNHVWARQMGLLGGHDRGFGLALDGQANVYTTGFYANNADFDPGAGTRRLAPAGAFVSKLNSDGIFVEAVQISGVNGSGGQAEGRGIAVNAAGSVAVTGWFGGTVGFPDVAGSPTLTTSFASNRDVYVARLDFNAAPTDVSLSPASVAENSAVGTVVGTLSTTDPDLPGDSHSYVLLDNAGGRFGLDGNQIKVAGAIDFEATPTLQITVQSTDAGGQSVTRVLTIGVTNLLEVIGFDVQHGQTQRSFVRHLDLAFADPASDVNALLGSGRVKLTRFNLDGSGAGVNVALAGVMSASGGNLSFDFGSQGIGGNRNTTAGDGYYWLSLDLDGNGSYETTRKFYRLLGDVNGDRSVTLSDALIALTAYNSSNPERDVNGDGTVNLADVVFALRSFGRRLGTGLFIDD